MTTAPTPTAEVLETLVDRRPGGGFEMSREAAAGVGSGPAPRADPFAESCDRIKRQNSAAINWRRLCANFPEGRWKSGPTRRNASRRKRR